MPESTPHDPDRDRDHDEAIDVAGEYVGPPRLDGPPPPLRTELGRIARDLGLGLGEQPSPPGSAPWETGPERPEEVYNPLGGLRRDEYRGANAGDDIADLADEHGIDLEEVARAEAARYGVDLEEVRRRTVARIRQAGAGLDAYADALERTPLGLEEFHRRAEARREERHRREARRRMFWTLVGLLLAALAVVVGLELALGGGGPLGSFAGS